MTVASQQDEGVGVDVCGGCDARLPLRIPSDGEQPREWVCVGCGQLHSAVLDQHLNEELGKNVRPTLIEFEPLQGQGADESVREFALGVQRRNETLTEKRQGDRHDILSNVLAVPVDDQFRPIGPAELVLSRNISTSGIALIHTKAVTEKYLALEFDLPLEEKLQVVMEVLRCRPFGPYLEIGGRFVTKMGI